ncbi:MAG TPA: 2,3-bisphosphoglycerate-independent phosphoglycerate mutase [Thermoanaerobaculia bacterium]|nr:2,3-bisphosphoglycerate-independent phosphoglycerate mutase [Thermoanaerobaculia bacterium]
MSHLELISRLAHPLPDGEGKIVLLVLDGLGDIRTEAQPLTPLEHAALPHLDALARRSALGRLVPVAPGVTPGSGPGHLALFGHDPTRPAADIGRGVLEALGEGLQVGPGDVAARGNFATADAAGNLTDRRAGRIPTEECRRLCAAIREALRPEQPLDGVQVTVEAGEGHRFVLLLRGDGLSPDLEDTDPQRLGVPPLPVTVRHDPGEAREGGERAERTAAVVRRVVATTERALAGEPRANRILLRGFSQLPHLPRMSDLYHLRCGAFAGYPLYRGAAAACGMEVVPAGKRPAEAIAAAGANWQRFDYFFVHTKQTDAAGEDGDFAAKVRAVEELDASLPALLELRPAVLAIAGDHSTPAPLMGHSWHPVPLLLHSDRCSIDGSEEFSERAAARGELGTILSYQLMGLLLANAGRLAKYGG